MTNVTQILQQMEAGDPKAADQLLPLVYDELRKLAAARMAQEQPGQTLQPTALVHEAYLRLVGNAPHAQNWNSRGHFFGAAAEAMRRILVDRARKFARPKHGGPWRRVALGPNANAVAGSIVDDYQQVLDIDQALNKLAAEAPIKAELVKLRYFAGMSLTEAAAALGVSRATADRYWSYAKSFLYCELRDEEATNP